jgi:hypothetical protein
MCEVLGAESAAREGLSALCLWLYLDFLFDNAFVVALKRGNGGWREPGGGRSRGTGYLIRIGDRSDCPLVAWDTSRGFVLPKKQLDGELPHQAYFDLFVVDMHLLCVHT